MKNLLLILVLCFMLFTSCTENDVIICNGNLKDKPLPDIKKCIYGKWKLVYTNGGIGGNAIYYDSTFIEFKPTDSIFWITNGKVFLDNSIEWEHREDITGDMNYIMNIKVKTFSDGREVFETLAVDRIDSDFLIIFSDANDGFIYHLVRN